MRTQDDAGAGAVAGHGHGHVDDHHGTAAYGQGQLCRDIGRIPAVDFLGQRDDLVAPGHDTSHKYHQASQGLDEAGPFSGPEDNGDTPVCQQ